MRKSLARYLLVSRVVGRPAGRVIRNVANLTWIARQTERATTCTRNTIEMRSPPINIAESRFRRDNANGPLGDSRGSAKSRKTERQIKIPWKLLAVAAAIITKRSRSGVLGGSKTCRSRYTRARLM